MLPSSPSPWRSGSFEWSIGESIADITALAVPVTNRDGDLIASIGLFGPSFRLGPDDDHLPRQLEALVTSTANALGI